jgi:hypothetical protein
VNGFWAGFVFRSHHFHHKKLNEYERYLGLAISQVLIFWWLLFEAGLRATGPKHGTGLSEMSSHDKYLVSPKAKINIRHNLIEYVFVQQYLKSRTDELQQSDPERDADLHFCCTSCLPNSKSAVSNEVDLVCFILSDDAAATATAFRNDKQKKF